MELVGTIESIIFRNAENGYSVVGVSTPKRVTCVGVFPSVTEGERVVMSGDYGVNSEFTATVSGKTGSGKMTRAYEFSYTPEAGSILKQLKDADWEKFCPQKDKDILSARENSWIE